MRTICLLCIQVAVEAETEVVVIEINMIMAYFERKGCVQRNLYLNCASCKKVLKRYRMVRCQVLVIGGDIGQSALGM